MFMYIAKLIEREREKKAPAKNKSTSKVTNKDTNEHYKSYKPY